MAFPPYKLLQRDYVAETQAKFEKLERLYHVGQRQIWDGKQVLGDLLKKHGGIKIAPDKRAAIGEVFTVILWGELAAWSIAADLALMLEDPAAKMAATGQAFDEARHFYVLRDYLLELGGDLPPLDGFSTIVLNELLDTHRLADKLLGMQLIVENIALTIFRSVAAANIEPVLTELMPYYERDEARHVGLGVMYLPTLLRDAGPFEVARLRLLQMKIVTLIGWGTHVKRPAFEALGIDNNAGMRHGMKLMQETFAGMRAADGGRPPPSAVIVGSSFLEEVNSRAIDLFFPRFDADLPAWQRSMIDLCTGLAKMSDKVLRAAA